MIRAEFLGKLGGVEKNIFIKIDDEKIYAVPEMDVDRTSDDGKASSVQFIHFNFSNDQVNKFKDHNNIIEVGIDHKIQLNFQRIILKLFQQTLINYTPNIIIFCNPTRMVTSFNVTPFFFTFYDF